MWHRLRDFDYIVPEGEQLDVETVIRVLDDGTEQRVKEAWLINHVYDEHVVQAPEETAEACMEMIKDAIRRGGSEFMTKLVMEADGHVEDFWTK
jgi:hypothetical protein